MTQADAARQKLVLLLVYPGFSEWEASVACAVLVGSHELQTVGLDRDIVVSESGLQCVPHCSVDEVKRDDVQALIVPGARDLSCLLEATAVFDLVRSLHERKRLLAAICGGPFVLAKAGVLVGRAYTVSITREDRDFLGCFEEAGVRSAPLVEDGHIVTAQGSAYVEFGVRVGERLGTMTEAKQAYYRGISADLV